MIYCVNYQTLTLKFKNKIPSVKSSLTIEIDYLLIHNIANIEKMQNFYHFMK